MEINDVIEHQVISRYRTDYVDCKKEPNDRLEKLISVFNTTINSLYKLKSQRDDVNISDSKYFVYNYFPLFNLYVRDIEGFSKFILGENVNQILIQKYEIEQDIEDVSDWGTSYENKQLYYNAFSSSLSGNPILKQKDIISLQKESKIFIFGDPIEEVVKKEADIKYEIGNRNKIHSLSEDFSNRNGIQIKSYDIDFFEKNNKELVGLLRHSLTDQHIEQAKELLRETDFDIIEKEFKRTKENLKSAVLLYESLEKEASEYKSGKTLVKRPNK